MQSQIHRTNLLQAIVKTMVFDVVGINKSGLDMNVHNLQAGIGPQRFRTFSVHKHPPSKREGGSVLYAKEIRCQIHRWQYQPQLMR